MKVLFSYVLSSLALSGCVYIPPVWDQATGKEIASIEVGVTDRATVIKYFGEPNVLESDRFIVHRGQSDKGLFLFGAGAYGGVIGGGFIDLEHSHIAFEFDENDVVKWFHVEQSDAEAEHTADAVVVEGRRVLRTARHRHDFGLSVAFDTNGRYLAIGDSGNRVLLWDLASNDEPRVLSGDKGCSGWSLSCSVDEIAFSPDGKLLAASSIDHGLAVWDVQSGNKLYALDIEWSNWWGGELVTAHAFSPDGKILLTASDERLAAWDGSTGRLLENIEEGFDSTIRAVAYSKDGEWIVVASDNGTARFIENDGFKEIDRIERSVPLTSVALSEDGKALAIGSTVHLELWELRGVEEASPLGSLTEVLVLPVTDGHFCVGGSLAFSPDKARLLGIAGSAVIWNAGSRKVEERLPPGESCCSYMPSISAAAFHPTGRAIVTTGNTGVYLYER